MSDRTESFLKQYENAIAQSDVSAIAARYADVFMFAGPGGVQSVKKEDFIRVVPKRKQWFASLGLVDSKVTLVDETRLDSKYSLVKTAWTMNFEKTRGITQTLKTLATYILESNQGAAQIVFQIDHQDLSAAVKQLQLE